MTDSVEDIPRLRRSLHFVPGGNERMFAKSLGLPADGLILDLEDSVTADNKSTARDAVVHWLQDADFNGKERLVRINPQDTPWGREDLEAIVAARPDALVLPKVATRASVDAIDQLVSATEKAQGLARGSVSLLLIGTEVPEAVFQLPEMAGNGRVAGITWGAEDLAAALGSHAKRDEQGNYLDVFRFVRAICLLAASAAEVQAIDSVYVDFKDTRGLRKECHDAALMGFTGKLTIHPDQIEIVNEAFTPSAEVVSEARELLAAFAENEAEGKMAFSFRGAMVDVAHLKRARRILAVAAQVAAQTS
jgi:citrate lyase subunit beta/citryl-CoA lyase